MLNKFLLGLIIIIVSVSTNADTVTVKTDNPGTYTVVKGDTLWDITGKFLNEPWLWPQVWEANPQIKNPHLIYPGDVISLQYKDGRPILAVNRDQRYVKISPEVRSYEKDTAIPAIPIDAIKQFLNRPLVVGEDEMETWPYVVSSYEEHMIAGSGNKVYVRGFQEDVGSKRFAIYRKGKAYINPRKDTETVLGYEALYVGDAVLEKTGDPASVVITQSNREILVGDRLAEESESDISTNFIPDTPDHEVSGNIISVIDGVSQIGQYQVVVVDIGSSSGIKSGDVLGVYQSGKIVDDTIKTQKEDLDCGPDPTIVCDIVRDLGRKKRAIDETDLVGYLGRPDAKAEQVELPEEYAAVMMIFRTFENISYALIMEAVSPVHIYDSVRNL